MSRPFRSQKPLLPEKFVTLKILSLFVCKGKPQITRDRRFPMWILTTPYLLLCVFLLSVVSFIRLLPMVLPGGGGGWNVMALIFQGGHFTSVRSTSGSKKDSSFSFHVRTGAIGGVFSKIDLFQCVSPLDLWRKIGWEWIYNYGHKV